MLIVLTAEEAGETSATWVDCECQAVQLLVHLDCIALGKNVSLCGCN